jgi:hypothetical protein
LQIGHADERDQLRRPFRTHARRPVHQHVDLALAADKRSTLFLTEIDAEARAGVDRLPGRDRLLLALGGHRLALPEVDLLGRGSVRGLVDEDPVHRRRGLQPRCSVDNVS